jgi:RHS repeat-associated protein
MANGSVYENDVLQFIPHAEGYVTPEVNGFKYVYQYKDHLGNIRLSYSDSDNNGTIAQSEIIEENNYYPFGLEHKGYNNVINGAENNYMTYNGKEFDESLSLNWHDFGFRNYDASLGRWMNIDNLSEDYYNYSPYVYTANNPIYYTDPDGQRIIIHYQDEDGNDQTHNYKYGGTYDGDNQHIKDVYSALSNLIDNDADVTGVIKALAGDEVGDVSLFGNTKKTNKHYDNPKLQAYFKDKGDNTGKAEVIWDSRKGAEFTNVKGLWSFITGNGYTEEGQISPAESLLHELGHAKSSLEDPDQHKKDSKQSFSGYTNKEEFDVIRNIENPASRKLGRKVVRKGHYGSFYKTVSPTSTVPEKKKKN